MKQIYLDDKGEIQVYAGASIHHVVKDVINLLKEGVFKQNLMFSFNGVNLGVNINSYPPDIVEIYFLRLKILELESKKTLS